MTGLRGQVKTVLQVHNRYLAGLGGEDSVLDFDRALLESAGVKVERLVVSTDETSVAGKAQQAKMALQAIWSKPSYRAVQSAIKRYKPDVVHVHNTFVRLSPSVFWACSDMGIPVVATLHNYRYVCANGLLFRAGAPCEECLSGDHWAGVKNRCYRESFAGSLTVSSIANSHRQWGTWKSKVDAFISFSDFSKAKFVQGGFPQGKICVMNQAVEDHSKNSIELSHRSDFVFVGRMAHEKGPDLVVHAWQSLPKSDARLHMVGDGPMLAELKSLSDSCDSIIWHGRLETSDVRELVAKSKYLVVASRCYETGPLSVIEAMSMGTPCIVPKLGTMPLRIGEGEAGIVCSPTDVVALGQAIVAAKAESFEAWSDKAMAARRLYESRHMPEKYRSDLLDVYRRVLCPSKENLEGAGEACKAS